MLVPIKELKVGMKLGQDVLCPKTSRRLLSKGQRLTSLSIAIITGRGDYEYLDIIEEKKNRRTSTLNRLLRMFRNCSYLRHRNSHTMTFTKP